MPALAPTAPLAQLPLPAAAVPAENGTGSSAEPLLDTWEDDEFSGLLVHLQVGNGHSATGGNSAATSPTQAPRAAVAPRAGPAAAAPPGERARGAGVCAVGGPLGRRCGGRRPRQWLCRRRQRRLRARRLRRQLAGGRCRRLWRRFQRRLRAQRRRRCVRALRRRRSRRAPLPARPLRATASGGFISAAVSAAGGAPPAVQQQQVQAPSLAELAAGNVTKCRVCDWQGNQHDAWHHFKVLRMKAS